MDREVESTGGASIRVLVDVLELGLVNQSIPELQQLPRRFTLKIVMFLWQSPGYM